MIAGTINLKGFEALLYLQTGQKTKVLKADAWHLVQETADKRWRGRVLKPPKVPSQAHSWGHDVRSI